MAHIILTTHDDTNTKSSKQADAVENPRVKYTKCMH